MIADVPEPSTIILVGAGLLALVVLGWIRARRATKRQMDRDS